MSLFYSWIPGLRFASPRMTIKKVASPRMTKKREKCVSEDDFLCQCGALTRIFRSPKVTRMAGCEKGHENDIKKRRCPRGAIIKEKSGSDGGVVRNSVEVV